ncbi:hypothetical protein [Dethiosulfatarculus sandiegensis]|uniref:hypothetical protein n=1 Tax=Dethiosulfatarculus sandiegensis TaxID=1429043 RepID=UPI0012E28CCA|nr:hypothetical protein [Dethiosulfatarculus sandiegensis]
MPEYPPWSQSKTWFEAGDTLKMLCQKNHRALARARFWSYVIQDGILATKNLLDRLCAVTCLRCVEPCCHRARIWADFSDLVFWRLGGVLPPSGQLFFDKHQGCVYLGETGCVLERAARPWVCTWYLCPEQKKLLRSLGPGWVYTWEDSVKRIKTARQRMVEDFIEVCGRV